MTLKNCAEIDYGALGKLLGTWRSESGIDISPEKVGEEKNCYREELRFEAVGDLSNAEEQNLAVVYYHQVIHRIADGKMIHNETGYYSWDEEKQLLVKSFSIPRGLAVTAGGKLKQSPSGFELEVSAADGGPEWMITQSPFLQQNAKTEKYQFLMSFDESELTYQQSMALDIYGRKFEHTDRNTLVKVI